jgi:hypothetical protein
MNKKKSMAKIVEISKEELSTQKVQLALELGGFKNLAKTLKAQTAGYQQKFQVLDRMVGDLREEAKELDVLYDNFIQEMDEQEKEGNRLSKELGVNFVETGVGKEWERIAGDILSGDYSVIKRGLKIDIS